MAELRKIADELNCPNLNEQVRADWIAKQRSCAKDLEDAESELEELREEKKQLREEKKELREEKKQLREEKRDASAAASAQGAASTAEDQSFAVALKMLGDDPGLPPPVTATDLQHFLQQRLGRPLPLDRTIFEWIRRDPSNQRVRDLVEASSEAYTLSATVYTAIKSEPRSDSEIGLAVALSSLIEAILISLHALTGLLPHRLGYNTSDRSGVTRKLLRPPDFCFWVDNTLVFMGEVKTNSGDIGAAVQELGTKMGKLVFADDCEGCHFRCKSLSHAVLFNRSKAFDLTVMADRIEVVHHTVNLFRLLCWGLRPLLPPYPVAVGDVLERSNGTSITILADRVIKKIKDFASNNTGVEFDDLANVYSDTCHAEGLIHAVEGPTLHKGTYKVALGPLGSTRRPANEGELRQAIQAVLRGVAALHKAGYVHRDIHWDNVLCIGEGSWMLSDLESVARAPVVAAGKGGFRAACWTSDTLDECGSYTTASDVQLVGQLMDTCSILMLDAQCLELKAQLTASAAASRPSAEQALRHPWFGAGGAGP
eukprot:XP_001694342.1 predicted protein [Chlamydomonas reinhardtii]